MIRPQLGQRVKASSIAIKVRKGDRKFFNTNWISENREIAGVYTGYRTVHYGWTETEDIWRGGSTRWFEPQGHREVWLIVVDPRKNPIHVFPEDCEIIEILQWKVSTHANGKCTICEILDEPK